MFIFKKILLLLVAILGSISSVHGCLHAEGYYDWASNKLDYFDLTDNGIHFCHIPEQYVIAKSQRFEMSCTGGWYANLRLNSDGSWAVYIDRAGETLSFTINKTCGMVCLLEKWEYC